MDDLISRDALVSAIDAINSTDYGSIFDYNAHREVDKALRDVLRIVCDAPAIDAEPVRHGEWVDVDYVYFGPKSYVCSLCKDDKYWMERYHYSKENYCPNCGAKMKSSS